MSKLFFTIQPEQEGRRISSLLRYDCHCSARLIKQIKYLPNGILLDGVRVFLDHRVHAGQQLTLQLPPDPPSQLIPRPGALDLYFEDEHILVLNKPPYVPVHPGPNHHDDSLGNFVAWHYLQNGENYIYRPVNRLDRSTSGLMCVAKHAYAQERLKSQFHTILFQRIYTASCNGYLQQAYGTVKRPIGRVEGSVLRREIRPDGAPSATHFQVLTTEKSRSLVALKLETGRTHQIRVHMASLGHPLTGDFLYGTEEPALIGRTALHSWHLSFHHPVTDKILNFTAPPPADFTALFPDFVFPDPSILSFGKDSL